MTKACIGCGVAPGYFHRPSCTVASTDTFYDPGPESTKAEMTSCPGCGAAPDQLHRPGCGEMEPSRADPPHVLLQQAGELFQRKNEQYGSNYKEFGPIMRLLFPGGMQLHTEDDYNAFGLICNLIGNMKRLASDPYNFDNLMDMAVYACMLHEVRTEQLARAGKTLSDVLEKHRQ